MDDVHIQTPGRGFFDKRRRKRQKTERVQGLEAEERHEGAGDPATLCGAGAARGGAFDGSKP